MRWLRAPCRSADIAVSNVVFPTRSSDLVRQSLVHSLVLVSEGYSLCMKVQWNCSLLMLSAEDVCIRACGVCKVESRTQDIEN